MSDKIRARLMFADAQRIGVKLGSDYVPHPQVHVLAGVAQGYAAARSYAPGVVGALVARGLLDATDGVLRLAGRAAEVIG